MILLVRTSPKTKVGGMLNTGALGTDRNIIIWTGVEQAWIIFLGSLLPIKPLYDQLVHGRPIEPMQQPTASKSTCCLQRTSWRSYWSLQRSSKDSQTSIKPYEGPPTGHEMETTCRKASNAGVWGGDVGSQEIHIGNSFEIRSGIGSVA
jgi:hypothetical protein